MQGLFVAWCGRVEVNGDGGENWKNDDKEK